jgi:hypothetical protein
LKLCPLQFEGMPVQARAMVVDDVLADLTETQARTLRANPTLLAVRCEAHLRNTLPELVNLSHAAKGRLTKLLREVLPALDAVA